MAKTYQRFAVAPPMQNKLQAKAVRLDRAKANMARWSAEVDRVREELYTLYREEMGIPDECTVIYEARGELEHKRMCRIVQEPRIIDVEGLRADPRVPEAAFAAVTKTVIDLDALDVARKRHAINMRAVAEHTAYGIRPNLTWSATGAKSEPKLEAGQLCVIFSEHLPMVQEA